MDSFSHCRFRTPTPHPQKFTNFPFCLQLSVVLNAVGRRNTQMSASERKRSMPTMTGRPGYRTMGMNGGSCAPHLARTPCVPLFSTLFNRGGSRRAFRLPGAGGGSFPLYGGTFARSYSVSKERKRKSAKVRKRAQVSTKERFRVKIANNKV